MRRTARVLAGILAAILLAGCSAQSSSAPAGSTLPPQILNPDSSTGADAPGTGIAGEEAWRQAYYDVVKQNYAMDEGFEAKSVYLWHAAGLPPALVLRYHDKDVQSGDIPSPRVWVMEEGEAVEVTEGLEAKYYNDITGRCFTGRNDENGNLIYTVWNNYTEKDVYELAAGQPVLLYSMREGDEQTTNYYVGDSVYTWEDMLTHDPLKKLEGTGYSEYMALYDSYHQEGRQLTREEALVKVGEFLGALPYQAAVPAGAPAWVAEYVKMFRLNLYTPYYADGAPEKSDPNITWDFAFTLREPPQAGGAPMVSTMEFGAVIGDVHYYLLPNGQIWTGGDGAEGGYAFYREAGGKPVIVESYYGYKDYYSVTGEGVQEMLRTGVSLHGLEPFIFCGDEIIWLESEEAMAWDDRVAWVEEKTTAALAALGYGALVPLAVTEVALARGLTWQQLEAALTEELCAYAKSIGQM